MNGETRDERLRRILREADPAQDDAELTTEEIRDMRRAVLTAVPEPRRRFLPSPALAGAAMAVLAAIVVLMMLPRSEPRPGMNSRATLGVPSGTRQTKAVSTMAEEKSAPPPRPEMNSRSISGLPSGTQTLVPDGTTVGSPGIHSRARLASGAAQEHQEEPRTRQIQFSTPGGTRVIWILTSDKAL